MDAGERGIEQLAGLDGAVGGDVLLEQRQKAQLLAVEAVSLGKFGKAGFDRAAIHADDAAQDLIQPDGGVGVELAQGVEIDIGVAGVDQAVELLQLGQRNRGAGTDFLQHRVAVEQRLQRGLHVFLVDAGVNAADVSFTGFDLVFGLVFAHVQHHWRLGGRVHFRLGELDDVAQGDAFGFQRGKVGGLPEGVAANFFQIGSLGAHLAEVGRQAIQQRENFAGYRAGFAGLLQRLHLRLGDEQIPAQCIALAAHVERVHQRGDVFLQHLHQRGRKLVEQFGIARLLHRLPVGSHADGGVAEGIGIGLEQLGNGGKGFQLAAFERGAGEFYPALKTALGERLGHARLGFGLLQLVPGKVAPVVENAERLLVLAGAEQIGAQAGATADHLPELDLGFDRLGEHQIDHFGHVDAGVEHIHRDGNGELLVAAAGAALEVVDQLLGAGFLRVDNLAELAGKLRIHFVEQLGQQPGVVDAAGEDDALAGQLAVAVADAVVHQVAQDGAVGVFVENCGVDFLAIKIQHVGVDALLFQLGVLLVVEVAALDAIAQELGGVGDDFERHQIVLGNRLLQRVVGGGQFVIATKQAAGAAADHFYRGGGQADLQRIEIAEDVAIVVVDGAMRFVGDDQVKITDVEVFVVVDQALVDADINACIVLADFVLLAENVNRLVQEVVEGIFRLLAQLFAITQKQYALAPFGIDQQFGQGNGDTGFAGAGRLHDQGAAMAVGKTLGNAREGFDLVQPPSDVVGHRHLGQILAIAALEAGAVLQGIARIEAVDLPWRITAGIVPYPDVVAVGVENHRPLAVHFFQAVGVIFGLLLADARILEGFLGLDHGQRLAVVVPQNVIGIADAGLGGLVLDFDLLPHLFSGLAVFVNIPAGGAQIAVDQPLAGVVFAETQRGGGGMAGAGKQFHLGWRQRLVGLGNFVAQGLFVGTQGFELGQRLVQALFLEAEFFLERLFLALELALAAQAFLRRLLVVGKIGELATIKSDMQPARQLPAFVQAAQGIADLHLFAMRGLVAEFAQQVEFIQHQLLGHDAEAGVVEQILEVGHRGFGQAQLCVNVVNHALSHIAQFDQRTLCIAVGVMLSVATHVCQVGIRGPQGLEVQ